MKAILLDPWLDPGQTHLWIVLTAFLVAATCGLVGVLLLIRRMALVGDAVSHSVLPGLAGAYVLTGRTDTWIMLLGAGAAGLTSTFIIAGIHTHSRIKQDAAIAIAFSSLFALGVLLVTLFAGQIHLDTDSVLFGEIGLVPLGDWWIVGGRALAPVPTVRLAVLAVATAAVLLLAHRPLVLASFDATLARSLGLRPSLLHYLLMAWLSVVVVVSFEAVGAIVVIAMLIVPGATGLLLAQRLPGVFAWTLVHAAGSAVVGSHLALAWDANHAACLALAAGAGFALAWAWVQVRRLGSRPPLDPVASPPGP